jgi:hypothetical protein
MSEGGLVVAGLNIEWLGRRNTPISRLVTPRVVDTVFGGAGIAGAVQRKIVAGGAFCRALVWDGPEAGKGAAVETWLSDLRYGRVTCKEDRGIAVLAATEIAENNLHDIGARLKVAA